MADGEQNQRIGLHNLKPAPGSRHPRKRVGRGEGSGSGKTSGRGHKGAGQRAGAKKKVGFEGGQTPIHMRMRKLRGPHMKKSMPFEKFRTRTQPVNLHGPRRAVRRRRRGHSRLAARSGPGHPPRCAGEGSGAGRAFEVAHRPRPRLLRLRAREDRGVGRHVRADRGVSRVLRTFLNAFRVADIRKKLAFTAGMLALYRLGAYIPAPGINVEAVKEISQFSGSNVLGFLNLFSGGSLQRFAIFALGIMPYITASIMLQLLTVVIPSLDKLRKEGEVGQQKITQYTRYLTVGLAFAQSIGYVFLFRTFSSGGNDGGRQLHLRASVRDRHDPHGGLCAPHVARRAHHPARHRQRDLADDLRLDRLGPPGRHLQVVEQPGPDLRRDDALPGAGDHRGHRLHAGGPAPDPRAVRQAGGGAPDGRRRLHLPAAAREHGRRDPGDLRRLAHGLPADRGRAAPQPAGRGTSPPSSRRTSSPTSSASRSSSSSSRTSTPPSPSTRWSRRTTSRSTAGSYPG